MAVENVGVFEELLRTDEALQAKLRAATDAYGGDRNDQRDFFEAVIAPISAGVGIPISFDEAVGYAASGRELSDMELEAVAGGKSYCYIIGGSDEGEDTWGCTTWDNGAGACDYVGISMMWNDH